MKKKLLGAIEALRDGVGRVVIADGRVAQPVRARWPARARSSAGRDRRWPISI